MKIFIVAAAAWAAGALLGYFVARLAYKHLRKRCLLYTSDAADE